MVDSSKKKSYNIWFPRGQQGRVLFCLLKGSENGDSIPQIIGCNRAGWMYKFIKSLKQKGYVEEESIPFKDSRNRDNRLPFYVLKLKYFLDYAYQECGGLKFNDKEVLWLNKEFNRDREGLISDSLFNHDGSIIKSALSLFTDKLIDENLMRKNSFYKQLSLKLLLMIYNQTYSPKLYRNIKFLTEVVDKFVPQDKIEELLEIHTTVRHSGINVRNKSDNKFFVRLMASQKLKLKQKQKANKKNIYTYTISKVK